jgi:hypothetical protein
LQENIQSEDCNCICSFVIDVLRLGSEECKIKEIDNAAFFLDLMFQVLQTADDTELHVYIKNTNERISLTDCRNRSQRIIFIPSNIRPVVDVSKNL